MLASDLATQPRAWRIWAACAELTASYSKSADLVHVATIAKLAGVRADHVSPVLRDFDAAGIYVWRKDAHSRAPGFLALPTGAAVAAAPKPADLGPCPSCGGPLKVGKASDLDSALGDFAVAYCPKRPSCRWWLALDIHLADLAAGDAKA